PRVSIAYTPGKTKGNVIRAGVGMFNDRSGPGAIADLLHSRQGKLIRYVVTNPAYPNPFPPGVAITSTPPSLVQLAPGVQIPQTTMTSPENGAGRISIAPIVCCYWAL